MPKRSQSPTQKTATFSRVHVVAIFVVASMFGGTLWQIYRSSAQDVGTGRGPAVGAPTLPPPFGNPAPPIQQKTDTSAMQATQGSLMIGVDPSIATSVAETGTKLKVVGGKAVADDFCIPGSPQKCLSTAAQSGVGGTGGAGTSGARAGGWTIDKDVANCTYLDCLGTLSLNASRTYQLFISDQGSTPTQNKFYQCEVGPLPQDQNQTQLLCVTPIPAVISAIGSSIQGFSSITIITIGNNATMVYAPSNRTAPPYQNKHLLLRSQPIF